MASMILSGDTSGTVTLSAPLVAGSNTATLPAATGTVALTSDVIGVGQTWQSFTSPARAVSTTYTNLTGKPIQVIIIQSQNNAGGSLTVDGSIRMTSTGLSGYSLPCSVTAIIPHNSTYSYNVAFGTWSELR